MARPLVVGAAVEYGAIIYLWSVDRHPAAWTLLPRSAVRAVVLNGFRTIFGLDSLAERVDDPRVTEQRR